MLNEEAAKTKGNSHLRGNTFTTRNQICFEHEADAHSFWFKVCSAEQKSHRAMTREHPITAFFDRKDMEVGIELQLLSLCLIFRI